MKNAIICIIEKEAPMKRREQLSKMSSNMAKIQKVIAVAGFLAAVIAGVIKGLRDSTEYR